MIQSNEELYQSINDIVKILKKSGKDECANQLENALSISTVPSEILGEIYLILFKLDKSGFLEQLGIKKIIRDALNYLDKILGKKEHIF